MPTAVKERLINLKIQDDQKYYEIVQFFLDPTISNSAKEIKSSQFLKNEIASLDLNAEAFPDDATLVKDWIHTNNHIQCHHYADYLERRKNNSQREYFNTTSEAYEFLYKIAPVKRVDGAWLYSLIHYWNDPVFKDFIQIYLEELGLGVDKANHVKVYERLLASLGLEDFSMQLSDPYYHQPAIQLALAYASSDFIPEVIGFNLGYEQLPLHLMITNYELNELGINAKYFNLHITIDNFENGHADLSTKAFYKIAQKYKHQDDFMRKLKQGFLLNNLGLGSVDIINHTDTQQVVKDIFKRKAIVGKLMHNNKCKFSQKTVNQWLSQEDSIDDFIDELIRANWLKLNQDPLESRFWKIIDHVEGKMYGVFTPVEKVFIHDWIAGYKASEFKYRIQSNLLNQHLDIETYSYLVDPELRDLQKQNHDSVHLCHKINKLLPYLAPHVHHQNIGLWSTQRITEYLFPFLMPQYSS